jgi:hypothetical protein
MPRRRLVCHGSVSDLRSPAPKITRRILSFYQKKVIMLTGHWQGIARDKLRCHTLAVQDILHA